MNFQLQGKEINREENKKKNREEKQKMELAYVSYPIHVDACSWLMMSIGEALATLHETTYLFIQPCICHHTSVLLVMLDTL